MGRFKGLKPTYPYLAVIAGWLVLGGLFVIGLQVDSKAEYHASERIAMVDLAKPSWLDDWQEDELGDPQQNTFEITAETNPEGVLVNWESNPSNMRGYQYYRGPNQNELRSIGSSHWDPDYTGPIVTDFVDPNAESGHEYCYRVNLLDGSQGLDGRVIATSNVACAVAGGTPVIGTPTPTPTVTPTPTITPTPSQTATPSVTPTPSNTPTITPTKTATPTRIPIRRPPRPTDTPVPTNTATPIPTVMPTPVPSPVPTAPPPPPIVTQEPERESRPSTDTSREDVTATHTATATHSATPTQTNTPTATPTSTNTPTATPTETPSPTPTPTATLIDCHTEPTQRVLLRQRTPTRRPLGTLLSDTDSYAIADTNADITPSPTPRFRRHRHAIADTNFCSYAASDCSND